MADTDYNFLSADTVRPISQTISQWQGVQKNALDIQDKQADQAWGQALQASTDPQTGVVDYGKAKALAAGNPTAAMGMQRALKGASELTTDQINQGSAMYNNITRASMSIMNDPSDGNVEAQRQATLRQFPGQAQQINAEFDAAKAMSQPDRVKWAYSHGIGALSAHDAMVRSPFGETTPTNVGGQYVPLQSTQSSPYGPGGITQGPGSVATTMSPGETASLPDIVYPATADDVKAGRARSIGQDVRVSGADRLTRFGLGGLLPPGAREVPGTGGGGGGVVNSDGTPVTAKPPRLLNVPGGNQGGGQGQGGGGSTPPTSSGPPPPPSAPAGASSSPYTGGGIGSVLNPGGGGRTAPASPAAGGGRSDLGGGVPVASANALAPNVGPASPPSPAVQGDVNAILTGMAQRQAAGRTPGTQTAYNTIAVGPGTEEAQGYKTSADKLAADNLASANFQGTQFPYVQALKNYGEGTKTGPTTDFWNQVAGTIRTPLAKIGINIGALDDNTQRADALGKWLANIQSGNPVSAKSDAELAQVLKGSASTHINETTGADMVKAGLALQRMNVAATREWNTNPALQRQFGTYLNYLGDYNSRIDPRAFAVDTYNPAQLQRLRDQLKSGSEADAKRFESSLALARRNGMISGAGSQAMP